MEVKIPQMGFPKGRNPAGVEDQRFPVLPWNLVQTTVVPNLFTWETPPEDGKVDVTSTFSGYKVRL